MRSSQKTHEYTAMPEIGEIMFKKKKEKTLINEAVHTLNLLLEIKEPKTPEEYRTMEELVNKARKLLRQYVNLGVTLPHGIMSYLYVTDTFPASILTQSRLAIDILESITKETVVETEETVVETV